MSDIYPQKGAQTKFLSTHADIAVYGGSAGSGKALSHSTPIPTIKGIKRMADIKVGDRIYAADGERTDVIAVHDLGVRENAYSIYLDTGYLCDADEDHLWVVYINNRGRLLKTKELIGLIDETPVKIMACSTLLSKSNSCHVFDLKCNYIGLAVMVMRYINNSFDHLTVLKIDHDDFVNIKPRIKVRNTYSEASSSMVISDSVVWDEDIDPRQFLEQVSKTGYLIQNSAKIKAITGMMDVFGWCDENGMCCIGFNDQLITDTMMMLLSSSGIKCYKDYDYAKSYYMIKFYSSERMFYIHRKYNKQRLVNDVFYTIKAIKKAEPDCFKCIEVKHESHMFLITESFVPTHNSYALLLEAIRHIDNPDFGAVIFRREQKQIISEGGLRDTALTIYPQLGASYRSAPSPTFLFPSGAKVTFAHLNHENEVLSWQGSQIPMTGFDELTHFSAFQFNYMLSRSRSTCGVRPYIRCTTNPDSDSWVAEFLSWWIDQETGFPIHDRSGVVRYFIRINDKMVWGDSVEELVERHQCDPSEPKSVTFVSAKITDNPILMQKDPGYLANLKALSKVERARLLDGNWKVRAAAGMYFPREDAKIIDWVPPEGEMIKWVMSWDLAASESVEGKNPDWTIGLRVGRNIEGKIVVADMIRVRRKAADVRAIIKNHAVKNGKDTWVVIPQDPGQAGLDQIESYRSMLKGYTVISRYITKNKVTMAEPAAAEWQNGNIVLVRGSWNETMISELEAFPDGVHDDIVDALSAAVRNLPVYNKPDYSKTGIKNRFKVRS